MVNGVDAAKEVEVLFRYTVILSAKNLRTTKMQTKGKFDQKILDWRNNT
jgi:hypothetical protein